MSQAPQEFESTQLESFPSDGESAGEDDEGESESKVWGKLRNQGGGTHHDLKNKGAGDICFNEYYLGRNKDLVDIVVKTKEGHDRWHTRPLHNTALNSPSHYFTIPLAIAARHITYTC